MPKISLITAVYNRVSTIEQAIESVVSQQNCKFEYIVVDGNSTDGTIDLIGQYHEQINHLIHEPDRGLYDALNKGIDVATGDFVGFLHADDLLAGPHVLEQIEQACGGDVDGVYGDLVYVDKEDPSRITRIWSAGEFRLSNMSFGWMPPHPTFYLRRELYQRWGGYRLEFGTAADYELMVRMLVKHKSRVAYIPQTLVKMRVGGQSNLSIANRLKANRQDRLAWSINGLRPPLGLRFLKPLRKLHQFWPGMAGKVQSPKD